jgi:hypothetical protein
MTMSTVRASVAELYTPIYDHFMMSTFKEEDQVVNKVYDQLSDSTKEYKVNDISGLGVWESSNELQSGNYEDPVLGYSKVYTQGKFIKKFQTSFEAVDQDEYALLKKEGDAKQMGAGARARCEIDGAQILINAFSVAGPDGQYGFDTDHPKNREETGTTYSNLLTGAFSHDNLELAETQIAANFFDPKGIPIMPIEDPILLYAPALRGAVKRVLSDRAEERPGTTNRDINRFAGRYTPIEWRYLAAGGIFGGSNTAWYIIYKSLGFMKMIWNQKPHFTSWVDEEVDAYKFKGRMLYSIGYDNWRAFFGSTGL